MTNAHKVGNVHHYGLIRADAIKYGNSGHTVTWYEKTDKTGHVVVEWDKGGEFEINVAKYDKYEEALFSYFSTAFGVDL